MTSKIFKPYPGAPGGGGWRSPGSPGAPGGGGWRSPGSPGARRPGFVAVGPNCRPGFGAVGPNCRSGRSPGSLWRQGMADARFWRGPRAGVVGGRVKLRAGGRVEMAEIRAGPGRVPRRGRAGFGTYGQLQPNTSRNAEDPMRIGAR